jgi:mono/diheme cytochrome c family protein
MILAVMLLAFASVGRAQGSSAAPASRSSTSGVYTAAQAAQGQDLYVMRCRSCHTPAGQAMMFKDRWTGHLLAEPFQFINENMPKDSPGALSPEETANVLAYVLQFSGMPAGKDTLPADPDALNHIQFDTVATQSRHS